MVKENSQIKKIYSFDVFDTLITRSVASPTGVFLVMQEKLKKTNFPETLKNNFYEIRKEAQLFATANQHILNKKNDCCFNDIYEVIKNNFALTDEETVLLKNLEIETETDNILPIDKNISKVKTLVESGEKVILISDMYHSSDVIRNFLLKCDSVFENIEIFTSGETGKLKTDGTSYMFVKEKYPNMEQIHFGDNKITDVLVPKLNGIKTERFYPESLKPYEKFLLNKSETPYSELSVGISKYVRSLNNSKTFDLGCSFAGPMLYGYVDFVLEQALKRGLKHLYFVARDGYVLKEIADIIINQRNIDIKTHYFYSSRIANRIPDETNIDKFITDIFSELNYLLSAEFIAKRLYVSVDDIKKFVNIDDEKKHLSANEAKILSDKLINNNEFKTFVIEKNQLRKELFLKYLEQEIDLSKNDFGFVDLNGTGRTQDNIINFINPEKPVTSFFLVNLSDMNQNDKSIKVFYSYSGDYLTEYLELFCRTEHGQTIGYEEKNGKILPILETENYEGLTKWGYKEYTDGLKLYAKLFCKYKTMNCVPSEISLFTKYFDYLRYHLDKDTEEMLRSIPFSVYGNEVKTKTYVPKFTLFNIIMDKTVFKNFLATKHHGLLKRILVMILILSNKFKINSKYFYDVYYRYFLG